MVIAVAHVRPLQAHVVVLKRATELRALRNRILRREIHPVAVDAGLPHRFPVPFEIAHGQHCLVGRASLARRAVVAGFRARGALEAPSAVWAVPAVRAGYAFLGAVAAYWLEPRVTRKTSSAKWRLSARQTRLTACLPRVGLKPRIARRAEAPRLALFADLAMLAHDCRVERVRLLSGQAQLAICSLPRHRVGDRHRCKLGRGGKEAIFALQGDL